MTGPRPVYRYDPRCVCGAKAERVGVKLQSQWHYCWSCKYGRRWGWETQAAQVVLEDEAADALAMIGGTDGRL